MKKIILVIAFLSPIYLKAQENIQLGKSKENVRLNLKQFADTHKGIKIITGNDSDIMIIGNNKLKTIIYYNHNLSNLIRITTHSLSKLLMQQQLLNNSYKKVNDNEYINTKANIRLDFIVPNTQDETTIIQTQIHKNKK